MKGQHFLIRGRPQTAPKRVNEEQIKGRKRQRDRKIREMNEPNIYTMAKKGEFFKVRMHVTFALFGSH